MRNLGYLQTVKEIDQAFSKAGEKKEVLVMWNVMTEDAARYLSTKHDDSLSRLSLRATQLTDECFGIILNGRWSNLKSISLSLNKLGNLSCKMISHAKWEKLEELSIHSNLIDAPGLLHLQKANFKKLSSLDLQANYFSAGSIKPVTKGNWSLLSLMLFENELTLDELQVVVLSKWNGIHTLWAKKNNITQQELAMLETVLRQRFALLASINMR